MKIAYLYTSHNSSILHKQSHALLCSSFEHCVDFYEEKSFKKKPRFLKMQTYKNI